MVIRGPFLLDSVIFTAHSLSRSLSLSILLDLLYIISIVHKILYCMTRTLYVHRVYGLLLCGHSNLYNWMYYDYSKL